MNPMIVLVAAASLGIDAHWEPLSTGGVEYVIQIEPQLFTGLEHGMDVTSNVPRQLDVRRYRITVAGAAASATAKAPAEAARTATSSDRSTNPAHAQASGANVGWQPLPNGGSEYIVQIDPQLVDALCANQDLAGQIPPGITVRRFRIKVGSGQLPHEMEATVDRQPPPSAGTSAAQNAPRGNTFDRGDTAAHAPDGGAQTLKGISPPRLNPDERPDATRAPEVAGGAPQPLQPDLGGGPLNASSRPFAAEEAENHTANRQASVPGAAETRSGQAGTTTVQGRVAQSARPWVTLSLVAVALLLSLGGNIYLAWIAWDARNRYRGLLAKRSGPAAPA